MFKSKKAAIAAIFFVALMVYVVYDVSRVMSPKTDSLYKDVPPPHMMKQAEKSGEGEPPLAAVKKEKEEQASDSVTDKAEAAADDMGDKVKDAATDTKQAVSEAASDAKQAASDAATDVKQAASEAVSTTEDKAKQAADTVENKVESATSSAPAAAASQTSTAAPEIHTVTTVGLKYSPLVAKIKPGDMVAWENMSSHDTQALKGLIPDGAKYWHSPLSENYQRTFTKQGIYVYKCTPHFGAGMGGVIIVGKPVNLDQIKAAKVKGAAKRLVKKAIAAAEKM